MLLLTRKKGEEIYINGDQILIKVVDIKGQQVKIGIEAPENMVILRKEVKERIEILERDLEENGGNT